MRLLFALIFFISFFSYPAFSCHDVEMSNTESVVVEHQSEQNHHETPSQGCDCPCHFQASSFWSLLDSEVLLTNAYDQYAIDFPIKIVGKTKIVHSFVERPPKAL